MFRRLRGAGWLMALVLTGCTAGTPPPPAPAPSSSAPAPPPSSAPPAPTTPVERAPQGIVWLHDVDPSIIEEIRYATPHNFTGAPVPGYDEPLCLVSRPLADALHAAQQQLRAQGLSIKVYDCYRPQSADDRFVQWAKDLGDQRMKPEFYPGVDKSRLFELGYIAARSGHSRGSSVDLTLVRLPAAPQRPYTPGEPLTPCTAPAGERFPDDGLDMGTGYDCFDDRAHTDDPRVSEQARSNRNLLRTSMGSVGLQNYKYEWWHFNLPQEPFPNAHFTFPITHAALP